MKLAASLLSADFASLLTEARQVEPVIDRFHWDVMDGHFVPNLTFGPPVVNALRGRLDRPFGIHLMIDHPAEYAPQFRVLPDDAIIFHVESADPPETAIAAIASTGARVGISLRPGTPLNALEQYLDRVAQILVMSVEPGFGGQPFLPDALERIRRIARMIDGRPIEIAVDGGIHAGIIRQVMLAGAEIVIAGSAVFAADDRPAAVRALQEAAR